MVNSFRQTVATPRKWPGRCVALEPLGGAVRLDPGREPGRIQLLGRRGEQDVDAAGFRARRVALEVARVGGEVAVCPRTASG